MAFAYFHFLKSLAFSMSVTYSKPARALCTAFSTLFTAFKTKKEGRLRKTCLMDVSMRLRLHFVWAHHFVVFVVQYVAVPDVSWTGCGVEWICR